ncbi:hypothetical protein AMECASPLE_021055 [Ameca splendens]|uniref:Secreted protein n=1 Tax=Ameca splendens TaxID=208324 RepID=A0ABV0YEJ7_9TELE
MPVYFLFFFTSESIPGQVILCFFCVSFLEEDNNRTTINCVYFIVLLIKNTSKALLCLLPVLSTPAHHRTLLLLLNQILPNGFSSLKRVTPFNCHHLLAWYQKIN